MRKNRYVVATAGIVLHLMIGSVYAWSVFSEPIAKATTWSKPSISFAFSLAIFFLGMSAAFMGRLVEKFGPHITGTVSAILYGLGTIVTGYAIHSDSLTLLYIGYGIIGGLGLGSGYVTPVSTIIKWFPDKRGLATGLAIMGFGFAAMLTGPVAKELMDHVGVVDTFYLLGTIYLVVMLIAAQFIRRPDMETIVEKTASKPQGLRLTAGPELSANQAVKTSSFVFLWIMLFINITCGIGLVSAASPMAQEMSHMNATVAAFMVGILGMFNGFGRLVWATLSDYIGRPNTFTLIFAVNAVMFASILILGNTTLFVLAFCILLSCYGAGFSVIPAYLGDVFGTKELGAIHGYILTAWAMAGIVGPMILANLHEKTGSYLPSLVIFIGLNLSAFGISLVVRKNFIQKRVINSMTNELE